MLALFSQVKILSLIRTGLHRLLVAFFLIPYSFPASAADRVAYIVSNRAANYLKDGSVKSDRVFLFDGDGLPLEIQSPPGERSFLAGWLDTSPDGRTLYSIFGPGTGVDCGPCHEIASVDLLRRPLAFQSRKNVDWTRLALSSNSDGQFVYSCKDNAFIKTPLHKGESVILQKGWKGGAEDPGLDLSYCEIEISPAGRFVYVNNGLGMYDIQKNQDGPFSTGGCRDSRWQDNGKIFGRDTLYDVFAGKAVVWPEIIIKHLNIKLTDRCDKEVVKADDALFWIAKKGNERLLQVQSLQKPTDSPTTLYTFESEDSILHNIIGVSAESLFLNAGGQAIVKLNLRTRKSQVISLPLPKIENRVHLISRAWLLRSPK